MDRKTVLQYVWLGVLLTLVLSVIVGPREGGIPMLLATYLVVADCVMLGWLLRTGRRS